MAQIDAGPNGDGSGRRADRVRAELVALGASFAQISVTGVGSDFPQRPSLMARGTSIGAVQGPCVGCWAGSPGCAW